MIRKSFDIVIVGSGAGGGTVAQELAPLAESGVRIAVLEWGPKLRQSDYEGTERELAERLYFGGGGELTADKTMTLAFARAYGGSTVVYTGTSLAMRRRDFDRWSVRGLDYGDLLARTEKHLRENGAELLPPERLNDNNLFFEESCRKLGWSVLQFPVNVRACRGSGRCNLGCSSGAKQGTHRVQLPAAERRGVQVVTHCRVDELGDRRLLAEVAASDVGEPSLWPPGHYEVSAKAVVVAAGAVQSPALLLRSELPVHLPALGRWFTAQPAVIVAGRHPRRIRNFAGHPKSFCCDHFADSRDFLLETCMYFPTVAAKNLAGFGAEHREMMARMDRLQMVLALALDEASPDNQVRLGRDGEAVVDYRLAPATLRALKDACDASARILFESGAERVHTPAGPPFGVDRADWSRGGERLGGELRPGAAPVSAAHLMGGCRMGASPGDSVTDSWGRVHGVPWLHVADASLFPAAARINPYPTIMALADRVAEGIRARARELLN